VRQDGTALEGSWDLIEDPADVDYQFNELHPTRYHSIIDYLLQYSVEGALDHLQIPNCSSQ
jgi:hypothetical protein